MIVALCSVGLAAAPGWADEGVIKYRQAVYQAIGGHMSAMVGILRGDVPNDTSNPDARYRSDLIVHADSLYQLSGIVPRFFPPGSGSGKTKALPAIWSKNREFTQRMVDFREAAQAVSMAAKGGNMDVFGDAFRNLGRACKGCHDNFKAE